MVNKQEAIKETENKIEKATENKVELREALTKAMNDLGNKSSCKPLFEVLFNINVLLDCIDESKFDIVQNFAIIRLIGKEQEEYYKVKMILNIPLKKRNIDLKEFEDRLYDFVCYGWLNVMKNHTITDFIPLDVE